MSDFDHKEWRENVAATENLESLKMGELRKHLGYFTKVQPQLTFQHQSTRDTCKERIELLRAEIHHRRSRKPSWVAIVSLFIALAGFMPRYLQLFPTFIHTI
jgi:hypothetical protein